MYEYIAGKVDELTPTYAVVEASGVGYYLHISLNSYSIVEGMIGNDTNCRVKLYTHYIVREDAQILYGFVSKEERELFRLLISVSGIGGNTARMVLSTFTAKELQSIIMTENAALLKSVKGLGLKSAQKIIVELSGKMATLTLEGEDGLSRGDIEQMRGAMESHNRSQSEAVEARVMLGFSKASCQKVVSEIVKHSEDSSVEEIIRMALKSL